MKNPPLLILVLILALVLVSFFLLPEDEMSGQPDDPGVSFSDGASASDSSAGFSDEPADVLSEDTAEPEDFPERSPEPTPSPIPLTDFYTDLRDELPGHYELVSVNTPGNEFSDELIVRLQQLGFPMMLELYADGSAVLGIFDQAILLHYDPNTLFFSVGSAKLSFFYLSGEIRVWEGDSYMLFRNPLYEAP